MCRCERREECQSGCHGAGRFVRPDALRFPVPLLPGFPTLPAGDGARGGPPRVGLALRIVPGPPWFVADGRTCVEAWPYEAGPPNPLPFVDGGRVPAGFPSPADDFDEGTLDLADLLVRNPDATFFIRAHGDSMAAGGIHSGDVLVVDRSVEPRIGAVVIAVLDGAMTVKRLGRVGGRVALLSEAHDADAYPPLVVGPEAELSVWGVVVGVVRSLVP